MWWDGLWAGEATCPLYLARTSEGLSGFFLLYSLRDGNDALRGSRLEAGAPDQEAGLLFVIDM